MARHMSTTASLLATDGGGAADEVHAVEAQTRKEGDSGEAADEAVDVWEANARKQGDRALATALLLELSQKPISPQPRHFGLDLAGAGPMDPCCQSLKTSGHGRVHTDIARVEDPEGLWAHIFHEGAAGDAGQQDESKGSPPIGPASRENRKRRASEDDDIFEEPDICRLKHSHDVVVKSPSGW